MHIVVAYDGSDGARAALRAAAELGNSSRAHITVVQALNPLTAGASIYAQTSTEAVEIAVQGAKAHIHEQLLAYPDVDADVWIEELERGEDVPNALLRVAKSRAADFIATGSRRAGTMRGLLLGSVASALIRKSERPVIVAHPEPSSSPVRNPWPTD